MAASALCGRFSQCVPSPLLFLLLLLLVVEIYFISLMSVRVLPPCMSVHSICVSGALRGGKGASESLELELWVVSLHVGSGN